MTEIFFPLASNINCFQSRRQRLGIEARLKKAVLTYDRVCYEDGRYDLTVVEGGSSSTYTPPELLGEEDLQFRYFDKPLRGDPYHLVVAPNAPGGRPVALGGSIDYAYAVCYRGLIEEIVSEVGDTEFFQPVPFIDLHPELKAIVDKWTHSDSRDAVLNSLFRRFRRPGVGWLKTSAFRNLNRDVLAALLRQQVLSVDEVHLAVLKQKLRKTEVPQMVCDPVGLVLDAVLDTRIPNLSALPWRAVIEVRYSPAWVDFRCLLEHVATRVTERYVPMDESPRYRSESQRLFQELWLRKVKSKEESRFKTLLRSAVLSLGRTASRFGLEHSIPALYYVGVGSTTLAAALAIRQRITECKHWTSVIFTLEKATANRGSHQARLGSP